MRSELEPMDMNVSHRWPNILTDWPDRAVSLWHTHRTPVIIGVLIGFLLLRVYVRRAAKSKDIQFPSVPCSPAGFNGDEKTLRQVREKVQQGDLRPITSGSTQLHRPAKPKLVAGRKPMKGGLRPEQGQGRRETRLQTLIFYCSLTGTTAQLAQDLASKLTAQPSDGGAVLPPQVYDLSYIELDDFFISGPKQGVEGADVRYFYCLLLPTYNIDTIITNFLSHLDETYNDFRIDTASLSSLSGYSVFGVGDGEGWPTEEVGFCSQAVEVDKWMAKLTGGKRAYPLGLGDVKRNLRESLDEWAMGMQKTLHDLSTTGALGEGVPGSGAYVESGDEGEADFPGSGRRKRQKTNQITDLEDVRGPTDSHLEEDFTTTNSTTNSFLQPHLKEMVPKSSPTYTALTKQGYTIIGGHSGVKICRWTKSALRGRGSCYKNSFYGIKSHLCMETTPSLSCSNKCVFCWRHGTNPVSTTWRWEVDDPGMIFTGAKEAHYKKIRMMKGVPGVRAERFEEAMRIKHCALSLVGEPIFYPRIDEFVSLLHGEGISSFLVCNAQHPDQLAKLGRVTQLYVSIDASNRDSLKRIDRPLHRDFWERFQRCLEILREKRFMQRTVFRLTLVKGFNVEEVEGYADLVQKGLPCFVEVKGVTYCGTSSSAGAGLTMQNIPFYEEVVAFVDALDAALAKRGLQYGIAAEHAHSCCVLLASTRFLIDGRWNTIIDYGRFFQLLERGDDFGPEDYCLPTPDWALWGRGGFDPADERVDRKGRPKVVEVVNHAGKIQVGSFAD